MFSSGARITDVLCETGVSVDTMKAATSEYMTMKAYKA